MKNYHYIILLIISQLIISCVSNKGLNKKAIICQEGADIHLGYRYPKDWNIQDSTINRIKKDNGDTINIHFQSNFKDTLETYINDVLVDKDFVISQYTDTVVRAWGTYPRLIDDDTKKTIKYHIMQNQQNPVLTIKVINKPKECFQLVLDIRYIYVTISRGEDEWFVVYSNFHVPTPR